MPPLNPLAALWAATATVAAPGVRLMLRFRLLRGKEVAGRLAERRGIDHTPRPPGALIWLHAASVGETMSILPVLPALAEAAPDATILLTTGTVTSATLLAQHLGAGHLGAGLKRRVLHRFVPIDVPAWAARFLDHWRSGCRRVRRKRAVAEPAGRLPGSGHSGDADQRPPVRSQPGPLAARVGAGAPRGPRPGARPCAQRDRCRTAARIGLSLCDGAGRSETRGAAAAGRRDGTAAPARPVRRPPGLARRQHAPRRGDVDPGRPPDAGGARIRGC